MDNSYSLTRFDRLWAAGAAGWPKWPKGEHNYRIDGRPISQWPRLKAGYSDVLGTGRQ